MSRFGWTIDGHPIGASAPDSGFARPFVHVLFDHPPDWRASVVRSAYFGWFDSEAGEWRAFPGVQSDNSMRISIDGRLIDCRLSHLPAPPARFAHEIANSPWFPDASAAVARHRRRAVLSPAVSPAEWAAAPHAVRIDSMRALTKVAAAFALLRHASATVWPVSQTIWAPRTAALVAHDPYPSAYWVRAKVHEPDLHRSRRASDSGWISARSAGLSAFVGCEVAVHAPEGGGVRRAVTVLGDVVDHLVRRGSEHRDPFRFARTLGQDRGVHIETVRTHVDD